VEDIRTVDGLCELAEAAMKVNRRILVCQDKSLRVVAGQANKCSSEKNMSTEERLLEMPNAEPTSPPDNRRPVERDCGEYPLKPLILAERVRGTLSEEDKRRIDENGKINWSRTHLHLANPSDVAFAAEAIADGKGIVHAFANFNAVSFHPDVEVMKSVNAAKGRPLDQVASVTTTRTHISGLFDWDNLPEGFAQEQVMRMINRFYDKGPFGFRGPSAERIPSHLTTVVDGVRTVQVIAPGYHCTSNEFLEAALTDLSLNI
jgi:hypothetical protein